MVMVTTSSHHSYSGETYSPLHLGLSSEKQIQIPSRTFFFSFLFFFFFILFCFVLCGGGKRKQAEKREKERVVGGVVTSDPRWSIGSNT
jgi:hypothetical protein